MYAGVLSAVSKYIWPGDGEFLRINKLATQQELARSLCDAWSPLVYVKRRVIARSARSQDASIERERDRSHLTSISATWRVVSAFIYKEPVNKHTQGHGTPNIRGPQNVAKVELRNVRVYVKCRRRNGEAVKILSAAKTPLHALLRDIFFAHTNKQLENSPTSSDVLRSRRRSVINSGGRWD
jgi:hypothetical protein